MKILITGVLGVIGSKLEEELLNRGHKVFGIDLYHADRCYGHGLGKVSFENYFRCDIGEYRQIENVILHVQPDIVFNCAAEFGRWNGENFYEKVWKTNVIGTKHIIRLQEQLRFKLVHCSSSEVYGDYHDIMYEDVLEKTPILQLNDYAMSKRVNEMQIVNSRSQFETETVIVRIFNTYGPGEWFHPFRSVNCLFCYNLLKGLPITVYKGHTRTSTYVWDCVKTIANITNNFIPGRIYNIASDENHSIEELANLVIKSTGADPNLITWDNHPEILTTQHKFVDASLAISELNHVSSIDLSKGVSETVVWMKSYYGITN